MSNAGGDCFALDEWFYKNLRVPSPEPMPFSEPNLSGSLDFFVSVLELL